MVHHFCSFLLTFCKRQKNGSQALGPMVILEMLALWKLMITLAVNVRSKFHIYGTYLLGRCHGKMGTPKMETWCSGSPKLYDTGLARLVHGFTSTKWKSNLLPVQSSETTSASSPKSSHLYTDTARWRFRRVFSLFPRASSYCMYWTFELNRNSWACARRTILFKAQTLLVNITICAYAPLP